MRPAWPMRPWHGRRNSNNNKIELLCHRVVQSANAVYRCTEDTWHMVEISHSILGYYWSPFWCSLPSWSLFIWRSVLRVSGETRVTGSKSLGMIYLLWGIWPSLKKFLLFVLLPWESNLRIVHAGQMVYHWGTYLAHPSVSKTVDNSRFIYWYQKVWSFLLKN